MSEPVTVLMPVFNGAAHLRAAVDSILAQTHREFELLIVDDGSTDASPDIVASYRDSRIRLERFERNRGLAHALNHGLQAAVTALVARQDQDDVSRPDRLAVQLAWFQRNPGLVILGSQARMLDEQGRVVGTVQRPLEPVSIHWFAIVDSPFIHTSVVFRREAAIACGGYDAAFDPYSQDHALWWRLIQRGTAVNLEECLVDYRVNAASITAKTQAPREASYRARFEKVVADLVARHALELFRTEPLSEDEARLLGGFGAGVDAENLGRFLEVFARVLAWYEAQHPEARVADFRTTLARQYDAIAYRVRPPSRRHAIRVYMDALSRRPQLARAFSWPRLIAMVALGGQGRARLAAWHRGARAA